MIQVGDRVEILQQDLFDDDSGKQGTVVQICDTGKHLRYKLLLDGSKIVSYLTCELKEVKSGS